MEPHRKVLLHPTSCTNFVDIFANVKIRPMSGSLVGPSDGHLADIVAVCLILTTFYIFVRFNYFPIHEIRKTCPHFCTAWLIRRIRPKITGQKWLNLKTLRRTTLRDKAQFGLVNLKYAAADQMILSSKI